MTTPTIADGRLYIHSYAGYGGGEATARVKCFDLAAPPGSVPRITQRGLPDGVVDHWYEQRLWVSSGNGHRAWSVAAGELPPGLRLDGGEHVLAGTPTRSGTFAFTLEVVDEDGDKDRKVFTLLVQEPQPLSP
jgi:hypothetical protein